MSNIAFIPLQFTQVSFSRLPKLYRKLKISFYFHTVYKGIFLLALIDLYILLDFFQLLFFHLSGLSKKLLVKFSNLEATLKAWP